MDIAQEKIEFRKKDFKRGIDMDESRRKRGEESIRIRKNRREEILQKRRRRGVDNNDNIDITDNPNNHEPPIDMDVIQHVYSTTPETALYGLVKTRKLLSGEDPLILQVVRSGVVPKLVEYLSYSNYPKHQYEAAWALTNIVSAESEISRVTIENSNIGPAMIKLIESHDIDVRDQAIWCLSNIAGECVEYRDKLLESNCLDKIISILDFEIGYEKRRIKSIRTLTWTMNNLLRGNPPPPFSLMLQTIPVIKRLYEECWDEETLTDAGFCLTYISDASSDDQLNMLFRMGVITKTWLDQISHGKGVGRSILRTCGNIISGPDNLTQQMLDWGFLKYLPRYMAAYKKEACWILSNITAGNRIQIQMVIDAGLIQMVIVLMNTGSWAVKKESIYVVANLVGGGSKEQIDYLVDCNSIEALCSLLNCEDNKMIEIILGTLHKILRNGKRVQKFDYYRDLVEEASGLDQIEYLQNSNNKKIYKKAVKILERHFEAVPDQVYQIEPNDQVYQIEPMDQTDGNLGPFNF